MSASPILSIIVPVYNVQEYVIECAKSILTQELDNCEVIFVDDGSTDSSFIKLQRFLKERKNKHAQIIQKQNGGLSSARNFGLQYSHGDYIWFVDSDDILPEKAVSQLKQTIQTHVHTDIFAFHFQKFGHPHPILVVDPRLPLRQDVGGEDFLRMLFERKREDFAWSIVTTRELFESHDVEFPEGRNFEDMATTYRLAYFSKRVVLMSETLYLYRIRKESISNQPSQKSTRDIFYNLSDCVSFFLAHPSPVFNNHFSNFGAYYALFAYQQSYTAASKKQMNAFFKSLHFNQISWRYRFAYILANLHLLRLAQVLRRQLIPQKEIEERL